MLDRMLDKLKRHQLVGPVQLVPFILRYRFRDPLPIPPLFQLILAGSGDPSSLFPGAPNRAAVLDNFAKSSAGFIAGHEALQAQPWAVGLDLVDWRTTLAFNMAHVQMPELVYDNGQQRATFRGGRAGGSLVLHRGFDRFFSDYCRDLTIVRAAMVADPAEAEALALAWLAEPEVITLAAFRGSETTPLGIQWWDRSDEDGGLFEGWILHLRGEQLWRVIEHARHSPREPYRVLREFNHDGWSVRCCATCHNFNVSGMSREMSGGSIGHCAARKHMASDTVLVTDTCQHFELTTKPLPVIPSQAPAASGWRAGLQRLKRLLSPGRS